MENLINASQKALASETQPLNVRELGQQFWPDYDKHVHLCIDEGLKKLKGDFWIMTSIFKDPDPRIEAQNVLRIKYKTCRSCPTPTWMQNVYRYKRSSDDLILLWAIPSVEACQYYQVNKEYIVPEEYVTLKDVLAFHSGELDLICAKENKEI